MLPHPGFGQEQQELNLIQHMTKVSSQLCWYSTHNSTSHLQTPQMILDTVSIISDNFDLFEENYDERKLLVQQPTLSNCQFSDTTVIKPDQCKTIHCSLHSSM